MTEWTTAKQLRKTHHHSHKTEDQEPCCVCGKHRSITHQHHVITLKKCAKIFNTISIDKINAPLVWLCPNCHAYVHKLLKYDFISVLREARIYQSISGDEFETLIAIGRKESDIIAEIYSDYIKGLGL